MRSTLDDLLSKLRDLEDFIASIEPVNDSLSGHPDERVWRYLTLRRRMDSAALIVTLYGAFEQFVEDLAWSSAQIDASICRYEDLADELRRKHLKKSGELLSVARLGDGRYSDTSEADVVSNLHACISGKARYRLNRHAVVDHDDRNLKADVVQGLFGSIGFKDLHSLVRRASPLLEWYRRVQHNGEGSVLLDDRVPLTSIEERLRDLVDRRNQIAHRGGAPDEALGAVELQAQLDFVQAYSLALYRVLAGEHLNRIYLGRPGASIPLGKILEGPFLNDTVVVVNKPRCRIFQGQPVLGRREGVVDRWGHVTEIQVDGRPVQSVAPTSKTPKIGLRLDFKVTKHPELYLLRRVNTVFWP